jgi:hypothetical protein
MPLTFSPIHEDLATVLQDLKERDAADGQLWCPSRDSTDIAKAIVDRKEELGTLLLTAVRFARLAARAASANYVEFIYHPTLPLLRADGFRIAVQRARSAGRLPRSAFDIDHSEIRLLEPMIARKLEGEIKPFGINFLQMPRLAAFLDILHNTLGYEAVAECLRPITLFEPTASAEDVARDLRTQFNAWLQSRLESAHRRTQAKTIHAFLASQKALQPHQVDDEIIFLFWETRATDWQARFSAAVRSPDPDSARTVEKAASDEGFRLYRSSVRSLLRYRRALEDATVQKAVNRALPVRDRTFAEEIGESRPAPGEPPTVNPHAWISDSASVDPTFQWSNPLERLLLPPASLIKWLTNFELKQLENYLGNPNRSRSRVPLEIRSQLDGADDPGDSHALMDDQPFDLKLSKTLLRVDVFGDAQAKLVARLRKRAPPEQAIEEALGDIGDDAYRKAVLRYSEIRTQLRLEALAALHILAHAGDPLSLLLIEQLGGRGVFDVVVSIITNGNNDAIQISTIPDIRTRILTLFGVESSPNAQIAALLSEAKNAAKKVHREGFRSQDGGYGQIKEALTASVVPLIDLASALDRICNHLNQATFIDEAGDDKRRFKAVFRLLYFYHKSANS